MKDGKTEADLAAARLRGREEPRWPCLSYFLTGAELAQVATTQCEERQKADAERETLIAARDAAVDAVEGLEQKCEALRVDWSQAEAEIARLSSQLAGMRQAILALRAYAERRNAQMLDKFQAGGVVGYSDMIDGLNALLPDADIGKWARDPKFAHVRDALHVAQGSPTPPAVQAALAATGRKYR